MLFLGFGAAGRYATAVRLAIAHRPEAQITWTRNVPQEAIRLHIGCASVRKKDFINIDVRPTVATDIVTPAWNLTQFSDNSVSLIYSRHMIEHLEPGEALQSLADWHRVLSADGLLHIICPDLMFHARQLIGQSTSTITSNQFNHAMAGFYGWKKADRGGAEFDAHRWGYTCESLTRALLDVGFVDVRRNLEGPDSEPWHLNLTARKFKQTGYAGDTG
jgi:hypothetical protein